MLKENEVDVLISNTTTGLSVPSLDAKLMNKIHFSPQTKRIPLFGLGCLAGTAALNRIAEYLEGHPFEAAIFFTVEICSINMQFDDTSITNLISSGLFGDGAAAVLMVGDKHPLAKNSALKWVAGRSTFFPNTERVMGWDFIDTGMKILMGKEIPEYAIEAAREIHQLLAPFELKKEDIDWYCVHPGGPKILSVLEKEMNLPKEALHSSWEVLAKRGNVSSVTILLVLEEMLKSSLSNPSKKGSRGLLMSLGPAFCSEIGLWEKC